MVAPCLFWRNRRTPGKPKKDGRRRKGYQEVHAKLIISSISSYEKLSSSSFQNFRSFNSWTKLTFHCSSSFSGWYLTELISLLFTLSTLVLFVSSIIFLKLCPVVDLTSNLTRFNSCFGINFLEFTIWDRKPRNLLSKTVLIWG